MSEVPEVFLTIEDRFHRLTAVKPSVRWPLQENGLSDFEKIRSGIIVTQFAGLVECYQNLI
jgi:hypothetical protein